MFWVQRLEFHVLLKVSGVSVQVSGYSTQHPDLPPAESPIRLQRKTRNLKTAPLLPRGGPFSRVQSQENHNRRNIYKTGGLIDV